ncbi:membrane-associated protease 1 [Lacrimispora amygdalina]|uniref:Membrane-associated protease 1 n=1 Tax=Lacrimispora amygdalina TaxID=253257 RepID=A0A3E2NFE1_9FIRM|nr:membrane-associated protease 1 [Clostridium indicum]RFZ79600.1 membrane-associated protease 1 [Clostridium indicum]
MAYIVKVEGRNAFELTQETVETVKFVTDIPKDSNARARDTGATIIVTGKIRTAADGDLADSTLKAAKWSLIPAESADAYQKVTVTTIAAGQVVRQITYPDAFVIDYKENFKDVAGVGQFTLTVRQKKDKLDQIQVEGGFAS